MQLYFFFFKYNSAPPNKLASKLLILLFGWSARDLSLNGFWRRSLQSFAKMSSAGSHPASGLSLLAESASRMPLTADRPNMREQLLAKAVEKKQ